ncbi:hypothetical protein SANTM175S_09436 [Streptomyces antimycoticus]
MSATSATPPSRAARLRLRHSLDVALRGADLLEQKLPHPATRGTRACCVPRRPVRAPGATRSEKLRPGCCEDFSSSVPSRTRGKACFVE